MSAFVAVVALMVIAAVALVIYPLLRPLPAVAKGEPETKKAAPLAFALAVVVALGAVALYSQINNFPWHNPTAAEPLPPGHGSMGAGGSMEAVTAALEARLQKEPNDLEGWRMLGRTYLVSGNAAKAASAYEQANSIAPSKDMGLTLDVAEAEKIKAKWETWGQGVRLVILDSPYRLWLEPLLGYIAMLTAQRQPNELITIVVPQFVPRHWWHNLLHTQAALTLRLILLFKPGIVVTDVPYHVS